jgi:hypothetical protein
VSAAWRPRQSRWSQMIPRHRAPRPRLASPRAGARGRPIRRTRRGAPTSAAAAEGAAAAGGAAAEIPSRGRKALRRPIGDEGSGLAGIYAAFSTRLDNHASLLALSSPTSPSKVEEYAVPAAQFFLVAARSGRMPCLRSTNKAKLMWTTPRVLKIRMSRLAWNSRRPATRDSPDFLPRRSLPAVPSLLAAAGPAWRCWPCWPRLPALRRSRMSDGPVKGEADPSQIVWMAFAGCARGPPPHIPALFFHPAACARQVSCGCDNVLR